jgi:hypothetical protein
VAQSTGTSNEITTNELSEAGFHLLSYFSEIRQQMHYQDTITQHQTFKIEWDSIPGQVETARREDVERLPLSPTFTIVERKQGLSGPAGKIWDSLSQDGLVIVASTSRGEIRGLHVEADPRLLHGEYMGPAGHHERHDAVKPKVTFEFALADDPQIQKIIFLKPIYHPNLAK